MPDDPKNVANADPLETGNFPAIPLDPHAPTERPPHEHENEWLPDDASLG